MVDYFLLGDSHIYAIHKACLELGISVASESHVHMMGPLWHDGRFAFRDHNFVFSSNETQRRYDNALRSLEATSLADIGAPFVMTVGYHTRAFNPHFAGYRVSHQMDYKPFLSAAAVRAIVLPMRQAHIDVVASLCRIGKKVFIATPPQRDTDHALAFLINDIVSAEMRAVGATVIDTREFALGPDNKLLPKYCPGDGDNAHGNSAFGREIMARIQGNRYRQPEGSDPAR